MSTIAGYRFGHVLVNDRELTRDVIVLPNRVIENWWRREGHELAWADLQDVADELPGRLVVGTGADQRCEGTTWKASPAWMYCTMRATICWKRSLVMLD